MSVDALDEEMTTVIERCFGDEEGVIWIEPNIKLCIELKCTTLEKFRRNYQSEAARKNAEKYFHGNYPQILQKWDALHKAARTSSAKEVLELYTILKERPMHMNSQNPYWVHIV